MRLEEIKERERKATKGPWKWEDVTANDSRVREVSLVAGTVLCRYWDDNDPPEAAFISHSREDIPFLLELVEEAKEIMERGCSPIDWLRKVNS